MALIECPECKEKVSDKAISCPHCGYPLKNGDLNIKNSDLNCEIKIELNGKICPICKSQDMINNHGSIACARCGYVLEIADKKQHDQYIEQLMKSKAKEEIIQSTIPKCPTCGSINIKKISITSRAIGAGLFGLYSKTARSQFKCDDCGYKW